jgi:chemotaxis protein MotA
MDKATIIGIIAGVVILGLSLLLDTGWQIFFSLPSFLIVMGGTVASTLINFSMSDVMGVMKISQKALMNQSISAQSYIENIVELSKKARTNGLLAIEQDLKQIDEEFLKTGLQHVVNGTDADDLRSMLEADLAIMAQRHKIGQKIFMAMGTYAPAFGMIGTLIGLIKMLQNLEDPSGIGPGMALAMVTTFYGALFANLFFLPMAGKLKQRSEEEIIFKEMLLQGILAVQAEESPRTIKTKLLTYLAPKDRNGRYAEKEVKEHE